jgi:cytochrome c-type biogenesis protein CcmH/NrfF
MARGAVPKAGEASNLVESTKGGLSMASCFPRGFRILPLALLLLNLMLVSGPAWAQAPAVPEGENQGHTEEAPEPAPAHPMLRPEQEAQARKIFDELISPCCWTTTVATHGSGAAPRIQAEVRGMIAQGKSHQQILDFYVAQYGERILAKPKKSGFNLTAYWVPYLAILAGIALTVLLVRKRRFVVGRAGSPAAAAPPDPSSGKPAAGPDESYRRQIEEELRRTS